jgi:threonine dehydratase
LSVDASSIVAARRRLHGRIVETPFLPSRTLSALAGCELFLKFENLQFTASFKERGAGNRLLMLDEDERRRGVTAMSAGNHAQGVAWHAQQLGIRAVIVMPRFTPWVKIENTRRLGAEVVLAGDTLTEARDAMLVLAAQRGLVVVHPYDDEAVIAGQGTLGLEMIEQRPDLQAMVIPVGGGGLCAGMSIAIHDRAPAVELYGVQVQGYSAVYDALHGDDARSRPSEPAAGGPTLAEGIAVEQPGLLTLPVMRSHLRDSLRVGEADIERAIVLLLEIEKTVVEGAGAAGLAAVMANQATFRGKRVGLVLSGGNIDTLTLADVLQRSLVRSRRLARLSVSARDTPGSLARIATIVAAQDANIEEVIHQRTFAGLPVRYTRIDMVLSTRGADHLQAVVQALNTAGLECHVLEG